MSNIKKYLTEDGLIMLLKKLNDKFSLKTHTHRISDINGLTINDGRVQLEQTIATNSELGIVRPGYGLEIKNNGVLDSTTTSSISKDDWNSIYLYLVDVAKKCKERGEFYSMVFVKKNSEEYSILMSEKNVNNFYNGYTKNFIISKIDNLGLNLESLKTDNCSKDEFISYETIKLLSTDHTIDAFGLKMFIEVKDLEKQAMLKSIGRIETNVITVIEYNNNTERFVTLGLQRPINASIGSTYILIDNDYKLLTEVLRH